MQLYFQIALLLLSAAPSFPVQVMRLRLPQKVAHKYAEYVSAVTLLLILNSMVFGLPKFFFPSLLASSIAIGGGMLYYGIERLRLSLAYRGTIRLARSSEQSRSVWGLTGIAFIWVAIAEELLFRWYLLLIPLNYFFVPIVIGVLLSGLAFGLVHQRFGISTMVSRGIFGCALAIIILLRGDLLFAILMHVVYNALVHLWPMQYTIVRYPINAGAGLRGQERT